MQQCTLLSVKTGGCSEDCSYCPQSSRYDTGLKGQRLLNKDAVLQAATKVKLRLFCENILFLFSKCVLIVMEKYEMQINEYAFPKRMKTFFLHFHCFY